MRQLSSAVKPIALFRAVLLLPVIVLGAWYCARKDLPTSPADTPTGFPGGEGAGSYEPYGVAVGTYLGVTVFSNGDGKQDEPYGTYGYQYECVEFVNRFYRQALKHTGYTCGTPNDNMRGCGHAKDYFGNAVALNLASFPSGATTEAPRVNDIMAFGGGKPDKKGRVYGHVAIIREVTPDAIFLVQQNYGNNQGDTSFRVDLALRNGTYTVSNLGISYPLIAQGWLRQRSSTQMYVISALSNPASGGTTSGGGTYTANSSVTVTGTPNSGYSFVNWTENSTQVSTSASYQFTATSNRSLVANFSQNPVTYTISTSSSPASGGTTSGGGTYTANSAVTVTATPNSGYGFTNWTENGTQVATSASYQFTATNNRTLIANFSQNPVTYTISTSSSPVSGGTTSGGGTYTANSSVTVTGTPNSGYGFVNWTENGTQVSTSASYQFTATSNRTLVANFSQELIVNGGFESGPSSWTLSGNAFVTTTLPNPHPPGVGYAHMGTSSDGTAQNNAVGTMYQTIAMPVGIRRATLVFWYYITSQESNTTSFDYLNITLQRADSTFLSGLILLSNVNKSSGYSLLSFDISAFSGQTVRLHFLATSDANLPTVFRIDDVSLKVQY